MKKSKVLKKLRKDLNGECGEHCPRDIGDCYDWGCWNCREYFNYLSCKNPLYTCRDGSTITESCPCNRGINPDELFLALDETIELLEEEGK